MRTLRYSCYVRFQEETIACVRYIALRKQRLLYSSLHWMMRKKNESCSWLEGGSTSFSLTTMGVLGCFRVCRPVGNGNVVPVALCEWIPLSTELPWSEWVCKCFFWQIEDVQGFCKSHPFLSRDPVISNHRNHTKLSSCPVHPLVLVDKFYRSHG